jgi:hypothetical protein
MKMQKKLDTVENNIKALKQIEMINPLHILEMEKCNTLLSQFKELIQSVSAENICEECPFHSKNHKTIRIDDHCTDCGCPIRGKVACLSCKCPKDFVGIDVKEINETDER